MKRFEQRQLREAIAHAAAGGQALHVCNTRQLGVDLMPGAPQCFKWSKQFAHLFDQNRDRLRATARKLGVRVIFVDRAGTPQQHIDLCGRPLERALEVASGVEDIKAALLPTP